MEKRGLMSHRAALSAPGALLLATGACAAEDGKAAGASSRTLVAYFSRSGNTRVIAGQLQRDLGAVLFEILLSAHDLSGKTVRPFITHGGFGPGNSLSVLQSHAPHARILKAFVMEADQERRTMNQVRDWLAATQRS